MPGNFSSVLFGAPLALIALAGLPLIWWLLRATPPKPMRVALPSFPLLAGLIDVDKSPKKTPWWLILLRILLIAMLIIAMALPTTKTVKTGLENADSVLFVVDDGWTSAAHWQEFKDAMLGQLDALPSDVYVHFLLTTAKVLQTQPEEAFPVRRARAKIQTLEPVAWLPNRGDAAQRLKAANITPDQVIWFTDGLDAVNSQSPQFSGDEIAPSDLDFLTEVSQFGNLSVYLPEPNSVLHIKQADYDQGRYTIALELNPVALGSPLQAVSVSAITSQGLSVATSDVNFDASKGSATAVFDLNYANAQQIARFKVNARPNAGNLWLADFNQGPKSVGLIKSDMLPQPLLTDSHYIENALPKNVVLQMGQVDELLRNPPSIIVMADDMRATKPEQQALIDWVRDGGVFVRFATEDMGEVLSDDALLSVPIRRQARNLSGSLNWEKPQSLKRFSQDTPFFGLDFDESIKIKKQVLASASPDLPQFTWASLADGSPIISTRKLGQGRIVFFHIGATPDWSNLVLSPLFPEIWDRLTGLAKASAITQTEEGQYTPISSIDAFGQTTLPPDLAAPLDYFSVQKMPISERHPPGYYRGPSGQMVRNVGLGIEFSAITDWPAGTVFASKYERARLPLTAILFLLALGLLLLEGLIFAYYLMRSPNKKSNKPIGAPSKKAATIALLCLGSLGVLGLSLESVAQSRPVKLDPQTELNIDSASGIRFGYIPTGEKRLDALSERGLVGLSRLLYLRTSVEPEKPHRIDLSQDALELYPLILWPMPDEPTPLPIDLANKLNTYMRTGGALIVDTRSGDIPNTPLPQQKLAIMFEGIDIPPLQRVPSGHVLNRSFYLINDYPGRFENKDLWIEALQARKSASGVSRIFIGDADWAAAWATDARGRAMTSNDGGARGREYAYRFGINLVMYILTGTYKSDQVHLPALIERLGESDEFPLLLDGSEGETE